jgi:hypothetical protein
VQLGAHHELWQWVHWCAQPGMLLGLWLIILARCRPHDAITGHKHQQPEPREVLQSAEYASRRGAISGGGGRWGWGGGRALSAVLTRDGCVGASANWSLTMTCLTTNKSSVLKLQSAQWLLL